MPPFFKRKQKSRILHSEKGKPGREKEERKISNLDSTLEELNSIFQRNMDFTIRKVKVFKEIKAALLYFDTLVDKEKLDRDMLKPLLQENVNQNIAESLTKYITEDILYHCNVQEETQLTAVIDSLLRGQAVLLMDGVETAFLLDAFKPEKRGIEQPETERVVRGPRDGFIEQLQTNIFLLRYRLPVPEFRVEQMEVGSRTRSKMAICYLEGIASSDLLQEVKKRINDISIDRILDAGYIEQLIQDNPRSPFPQIQNTERPDKAVGNILEGRVVLLVDGSPFALIVPAVFNQFYHTSEDYNERWLISSIIRMIRFMSLIFSLTFSSLYVTVLSFHPELIPAKFVVAASSGRAGVPFPVVVEVLVMEVAMEILREATVRMPQQVGGALSIVGVLVIGQAAVMAGFVSPITVVIIALSTIGSFATPSYNAATAFRMLRFPLIISSGILGLLGLATVLMFIINHMLSLRSFGVPYLAPVSPGNIQGLKDSLIRSPLRLLKERPDQLQPEDITRVDSGIKSGATNALQNSKGGDSNEET